MSLLDELVSVIQPPLCDCPGRWKDPAGRYHCEVCDPAPHPTLIVCREIRVGDGWMVLDKGAAKKPPKSRHYDPWSGDKPPAGTWHPIGDPVRQAASQEAMDTPGRCRCGSTSESKTPCRNGEWVRIECAKCKRTIRIE